MSSNRGGRPGGGGGEHNSTQTKNKKGKGNDVRCPTKAVRTYGVTNPKKHQPRLGRAVKAKESKTGKRKSHKHERPSKGRTWENLNNEKDMSRAPLEEGKPGGRKNGERGVTRT